MAPYVPFDGGMFQMSPSVSDSEAYLVSFAKRMKEDQNEALKKRENAIRRFNTISAERDRLEELFRRIHLNINRWTDEEAIYIFLLLFDL